MSGFYQALAAKLAERWVTFLVVPGAIFVAAVWAAAHLGQARAVDWHALTRYASATTAVLARQPAATQALLAVVVLVATIVASLAVQALAGITRLIWLGLWPRPVAAIRRWQVGRRAARWSRLLERRRRLEQEYPRQSRSDAQQLRINTSADRLNRLSWVAPGRPTWMGDRINGVERIARDRYGLDLRFAWPRLWLLLPETSRAEITTANTAFAAAVAVGTWAWPYLALGIAWWPAALIGVGVGVTGWARARDAVGELAAITEAALDLHGRALAVALGVAEPGTAGPLSLAEGEKITGLVRKGR